MERAVLPILAKCQRCGRGFVSLPREHVIFDPFSPALGSRVEPRRDGTCGGRIELTAEGRLEKQRTDLQKSA
jgi:hypothetical protein